MGIIIKRIVTFVVVLIIAAGVYWVWIDAPVKEVSYTYYKPNIPDVKRGMYRIYYSWDGERESSARWTVGTTDDGAAVVIQGDVWEPKGELYKLGPLTLDWIADGEFPGYYLERKHLVLMMIFGTKPLLQDETAAFLEIYKKLKEKE